MGIRPTIWLKRRDLNDLSINGFRAFRAILSPDGSSLYSITMASRTYFLLRLSLYFPYLFNHALSTRSGPARRRMVSSSNSDPLSDPAGPIIVAGLLAGL